MNVHFIRQDIIRYLELNGNKFTSCKVLANNLNLSYHQVYHAINSVSEYLCLFEKQYSRPIKYRIYQ